MRDNPVSCITEPIQAVFIYEHSAKSCRSAKDQITRIHWKHGLQLGLYMLLYKIGIV
jgi:hypothetical protein